LVSIYATKLIKPKTKVNSKYKILKLQEEFILEVES